MQSSQALAIAISMLSRPNVTIRIRHAPLPKGVTFLLEVAAGDAEALRNALALTRCTEENLRKAAGFFIEQVLLHQHADYYRVLGGDRGTPQSDLRRHMALVMRWLHPDIVSNGATAHRFDRGLYADRITEAWDAIKTKERRAAYDASLATSAQIGPSCGAFRPLLLPAVLDDTSTPVGVRRKKLRVLTPLKCKSFWEQMRLLLRGQP